MGRWDSSCRGLAGPQRASIGMALAAFIVPMIMVLIQQKNNPRSNPPCFLLTAVEDDTSSHEECIAVCQRQESRAQPPTVRLPLLIYTSGRGAKLAVIDWNSGRLLHR